MPLRGESGLLGFQPGHLGARSFHFPACILALACCLACLCLAELQGVGTITGPTGALAPWGPACVLLGPFVAVLTVRKAQTPSPRVLSSRHWFEVAWVHARTVWAIWSRWAGRVVRVAQMVQLSSEVWVDQKSVGDGVRPQTPSFTVHPELSVPIRQRSRPEPTSICLLDLVPESRLHIHAADSTTDRRWLPFR